VEVENSSSKESAGLKLEMENPVKKDPKSYQEIATNRLVLHLERMENLLKRLRKLEPP